MLLVITGAGASRDVIRDAAADAAPPLARDLFAPRFHGFLNKFPGASAAANRVLQGMEAGGSLEGELQKLTDQTAKGYEPLKAQLLAVQFFLQDVSAAISRDWGSRNGGMNNYATLVATLEEWRNDAESRILYVTFNYDSLLEEALERELGRVFARLDDYLDAKRAVVKVHGSWNWKREVMADPPLNVATDGDYWSLIRGAGCLQYQDAYRVDPVVSRVRDQSGLLAPAVAIPIVNKHGPEEFACPREHLDLMRKWLPDVTDVLVIGWRGMEAHFLRELKAHVSPGVPVSIVGSRRKKPDGSGILPVIDCRDAAIPWVRKAGLGDHGKVYPTGFSEFARLHLVSFLGTLSR